MTDTPPAKLADELWEALKRQCATTPDKSLVKTLVAVRRADIDAAVASLSLRTASPPAPALDARTVEALFDKLSKEVREHGYRLLNEANHAAEVGTGDVQFAATAGAAVTSDILSIIAKHRALAIRAAAINYWAECINNVNSPS